MFSGPFIKYFKAGGGLKQSFYSIYNEFKSKANFSNFTFFINYYYKVSISERKNAFY
jgi:hypothetical protein